MQPIPSNDAPPATISVKEIGEQMAQLRASFSLSQQEVSERLHIRARYVAAIEEGRLDALPGRAYARGYVQTYAEFLGLDADKIVAQCFAAEGALASIVEHRPPSSMQPSSARNSLWLRRAVAMAAVAVIAALISNQLTEGAHTSEEPGIASVPEDMLADLRNRIMPGPRNVDCLARESIAMCLATDGVARDLAALNAALTVIPYSEPIDVSGIALAQPEEEPAQDAAAPSALEESVSEIAND